MSDSGRLLHEQVLNRSDSTETGARDNPMPTPTRKRSPHLTHVGRVERIVRGFETLADHENRRITEKELFKYNPYLPSGGMSGQYESPRLMVYKEIYREMSEILSHLALSIVHHELKNENKDQDES